MDTESVKVAILIGCGVLATLWVLSTLLFRVAGVWERSLSADEADDGARRERITLAQLGPFVTGRRDVRGGYQEFSGLIFGARVRLVRRDHGVGHLVSMGFPDAIAKKLDGEVMARLDLRLVDGIELVGSFEPQKVDFTHQPPRVTAMTPYPKKGRKYRRVEAIGAASRAFEGIEEA